MFVNKRLMGILGDNPFVFIIQNNLPEVYKAAMLMLGAELWAK
jgi:hypothetical protein